MPQSLKVYLDSPMVIKVTEVHRRKRHRHHFDAQTQAIFTGGGDPFKFTGLTECSEFRKELLEPMSEPCIILCSPGMGNGGRALSQLEARLEYDNNTVLFVGFQARGTIGRALLAVRESLLQAPGEGGAPVVRDVQIKGQQKRVNAVIEFMGDYSAHGDSTDIIRLLAWRRCSALPKLSLWSMVMPTLWTRWRSGLRRRSGSRRASPR